MIGSLDKVIRAAASRYGVSGDTLVNIANIESGGNPSARNPSGASGLFQFMGPTAKQYGLSDPTDPVAAADAAARLLRDNARALANGLHRAPTPGELYLAHQQGVGGALKLLTNFNTPATKVIGQQAVTQNGGNANMTAGQFASMWITKFDKRTKGTKTPDIVKSAIADATPADSPDLNNDGRVTIEEIYRRLDGKPRVTAPVAQTVNNDFYDEPVAHSIVEKILG